MRLFVAVEISDSLKIAAVEAAERFRQRLSRQKVQLDARWVPAGNLHITLQFIGDVDDKRATAIVAALRPSFPHDPFEVVLRGLGAFPASGPPRIIWLGVVDGQAGLAALHGETAARLQPLGIEPERRPYSAHVTLARVKDVRRPSIRILRQALDETPVDTGSATVSAVTVFRSRVSSRGSTYEPLVRVPLK